MQEDTFKGFSKETWAFLAGLQKNNNKAWFENHRSDYEEFVMAPMRALVVGLSFRMLELDSRFETRPVVNKTLSRIFRDTRFSKNKAPYRSEVWLAFKRPSLHWQEDPCFFFEISPTLFRYGMGFYSASRDTMDALRQDIKEKHPDFLAAYKCYIQQKQFKLEGEQYKRTLDASIPAAWQPWYQSKSLHFMSVRQDLRALERAAWLQALGDDFYSLKPIYHFLRRARQQGTRGKG